MTQLQQDTVQFFISDQHCDPGGTLLHYAIMVGHMDIVKFLTVEKHCDPVSQDTLYYFTALHYVVIYGHFEIVNFLKKIFY